MQVNNKIQKIIRFTPADASFSAKTNSKFFDNTIHDDARSVVEILSETMSQKKVQQTAQRPKKIVFFPEEPEKISLRAQLNDGADVFIEATRHGYIKQLNGHITKDGKFKGLKGIRKNQITNKDIQCYFAQLQKHAKEGFDFFKEFMAALTK